MKLKYDIKSFDSWLSLKVTRPICEMCVTNVNGFNQKFKSLNPLNTGKCTHLSIWIATLFALSLSSLPNYTSAAGKGCSRDMLFLPRTSLIQNQFQRQKTHTFCLDLVQNSLVFYCTITHLAGMQQEDYRITNRFVLLHILIDNFRIYICLCAPWSRCSAAALWF